MADQCRYGDITFDGSVAELFVYSGLDVFNEGLLRQFSARDECCVGNCKLVFSGVKRFELLIRPYSRNTDGKVSWKTPLVRKHEGNSSLGGTHVFYLGGGKYEKDESVDIEIEAQEFALHIL